MIHTVASSKNITVVKIKEKDLLEALGLDETAELSAANVEQMLGEDILTLSIIHRIHPPKSM